MRGPRPPPGTRGLGIGEEIGWAGEARWPGFLSQNGEGVGGWTHSLRSCCLDCKALTHSRGDECTGGTGSRKDTVRPWETWASLGHVTLIP